MSIEAGNVVGHVSNSQVEAKRVIRVIRNKEEITVLELIGADKKVFVSARSDEINYLLPGFEKALGFRWSNQS